jgi:hypothetical protein
VASFRELVGAMEALMRSIRSNDTCAGVRAGSVYSYAERLCDEARRGINRPIAWTDFVRASHRATPAMIRAHAEAHGLPLAEAGPDLMQRLEATELWVNSKYQVAVHRGEGVTYLSAKRLDQQPLREWRDLQAIKNSLVGPEFEAVEIFPAESRKVDEANQAHLFVVTDPDFRFPFGFDARKVAGPDPQGTHGQEPFAAGDPWNAEGAAA